MIDLFTKIAEIKKLQNQNLQDKACTNTIQLIQILSISDLKINITYIEDVISGFRDKKRKILNKQLIDKIGYDSNVINEDNKLFNVTDFKSKLFMSFNELANDHIFRWDTYYKDVFIKLFNDCVLLHSYYSNKDEIINVLINSIIDHSHTIFNRGYTYNTKNNTPNSHDIAIIKARSGCYRFIEVILDIYSNNASKFKEDQTYSIRCVCSAMLYAIISGYGTSIFGTVLGWDTLSNLWQDYLLFFPFIEYKLLIKLYQDIPQDEYIDDVKINMLPIVYAMDKYILNNVSKTCLPTKCQYIQNIKSFKISLEPLFKGSYYKSIDILCCLDDTYLDVNILKENYVRGVRLVSASFNGSLFQYIKVDEDLRSIVIDTQNSFEDIAEKASKILEFNVKKEFSSPNSSDPILINIASDFPLDSIQNQKFFHVHRPSIRDLMRSFEQRNGIRLWCSIRRSGKTTGCYELNDVGNSDIVYQTCENTDNKINGSYFYEHVLEALNNGKQITSNFFDNIVVNCGMQNASNRFRYVFLLDEYETLFNRLKLSVRKDEELRYTVVQPLMNQMVSFSQKNLIVFIGQMPDAHYILMDQNQLSAYVRQDTFPLFTHKFDDISSEFSILVSKIITSKCTCNIEFLNKLYSETAGHPYLTVNILIIFFDWLIENKVPLSKLQFGENEYASFAKDKLTGKQLSMSRNFNFFKYAVLLRNLWVDFSICRPEVRPV